VTNFDIESRLEEFAFSCKPVEPGGGKTM